MLDPETPRGTAAIRMRRKRAEGRVRPRQDWPDRTLLARNRARKYGLTVKQMKEIGLDSFPEIKEILNEGS